MGGSDAGSSEINDPADEYGSLRVLLLPLTRRDAEAIVRLLASEKIECKVEPTMTSLCAGIQQGVGALIVSEESLPEGADELAAHIARQPVWSDLPLIILSRWGAESQRLNADVARLGNASLVERPVRVSTLLSLVRAAQCARVRQYEVRTHLAGTGPRVQRGCGKERSDTGFW